MEISKLNRKDYFGVKFESKYRTKGFFDIQRNPNGFSITYKPFEEVKEKSFEDSLFAEWLEEPSAYGAFDNGRLLGFIEGSIEKWNNRYRISNINIFDENDRNCGIGTKLMNVMFQAAKDTGARMVILETQTCNEKAISFYRKLGFDIIGFDLYSYSNEDVENCEVRIEMGKIL